MPLAKMNRPKILLVVLTLLSTAFMIWAAWFETPTVDEYAHLPAGLAAWTYGDFSIYSKNPPLAKLWMSWPAKIMGAEVPPVNVSSFGWGPWEYGLQFEHKNFDSYLGLFFSARLMTILLTLATAGVIYQWTKSDVGIWPATLATSGFLFSPTVLAHGHLATTDMACALMLTSCCFFLSRKRHLLSGIFLGLSLASKFSAVFILPWFLYRHWKMRQGSRSIAALSLPFVVLFACYGFQNLFPAWGEFSFYSSHFRGLPFPSWLRLPVPHDFIAGFDAQMSDAETGEFGNYLLGAHSLSGWWDYNLLAFLFKENPITILLTTLSIYFHSRRPGNRFLVAPLACLGLPLLFFNPLQVGIRYLLPLFPFLFIWIAEMSPHFLKKKVCLPVIAFWVGSAAWAAPNFISYFNPLVLVTQNKEELLIDSNLDWGQDLYRITDFAKTLSPKVPLYLLYFGHTSIEHYLTHFEMVPSHPVKGWVVVSPNFVKGLEYVTPLKDGFAPVGRDHLQWMRGLKPSGHLGALLVYDLRE